MALDLKAALGKARDKRAASVQGNLAIEVTKIDKMTLTGIVKNGPAAGTEIEIMPNGHLKMSDYTKKGGKSEVEIGGTVRAEGVREGDNGVYQCRWMKTLNGKPGPLHETLHGQTASARVWEKNGKLNGYVMTLDLDGQSQAASADELRDQIGAALESHKGANIYAVTGGEVVNMSWYLRSTVTDGVRTYEDAQARAAEIVAAIAPPEDLTAALAETPISVVPSTTRMIGTGTLEAMQKNMKDGEAINTVDPDEYKSVPIGTRLAWELASTRQGAIAKEHAELLTEDFLENAPDAAVEAFKKNSFHGVSDTHMRDYFKSKGVELAEHPTQGWATSSIVLLAYNESREDFMAVKTFATTAAQPYPAVAALEDVRKAFYEEIGIAARAAIETIQNGVSNTAKAETKADAKAETKADEPVKEETKAEAAAATPDEAEADEDVKNMLDELASLDIDANMEL